jgi:hypothetical protein
VCWGCDGDCRADDLACGNGSERSPHPLELFGAAAKGLRLAACGNDRFAGFTIERNVA